MEYKTTGKITKEKIREVVRIKESKGLTAENLLEVAKNKNNPLHDLFEWDNTKAAEQYRLQQARVFINEIKIIVDTKEYFAFENVSVKVDSVNDSREYVSRADIMSDSVLRQQIAEQAHKQLI